MDLIIYGSKYGHTKAYAEEYSRRTGIPCEDYCEVSNIDCLSTVIYFGALYAGGVLGLKKTLDKMNWDDTRIIVVTVGLSDPDDEKNILNIENSMKEQLTEEIFNKLQIYHLRGGIDYSRLNFVHRTMMKLLYNKAKNVTDPDAETRAMIETYGKKVSFVDFNSLNKIGL